jgi:CheY-like chemotaxis protein
MMGGELKVQSELGTGSRFSFILPFERAQTQRVKPNRLPAAPDGQFRAPVVDDNESTREALHSMISAMGWHCDTVDGGRQALLILQQDAARNVNYDVVFMDWKMPDLDGWQTTRLIREGDGVRAPIIIMISAHGREALAERLLEQPAIVDGFLVKPVIASMLFDAVSDAMAGSTAQNKVAQNRPASNRLKGLRLLVVEDNVLNQQVAFELLSDEGAHVTVTGNGQLGVRAALWARRPFDAVLMDIPMPDIDGYEATAKIRRQQSLESMPIIAMTANALAEDKAACLAAGMNDHIGKPIDLDILVLTVLKHCRREGGEVRHFEPAASPAADTSQDFRDALRRIGENHLLFADLAKLFSRGCTTLAADLQRHILREDKAAAGALLHTLQGTAGTVGAMSLVNYVAALERQLLLAGNTASVVFSADEFDAVIRHSCNELRIFAENLSSDSTTSIKRLNVLDKPRLARLLDELAELMRDRNVRATNVFDELRFTCGMALGDKLADLQQAMNELESALRSLPAGNAVCSQTVILPSQLCRKRLLI